MRHSGKGLTPNYGREGAKSGVELHLADMIVTPESSSTVQMTV
jgi:hypothetical protein